MTAKAVMFDFSGTLMHITDARTWLTTALAAAGIPATDPDIDLWAPRLEHAGALPGGPSPAHLPPDLQPLWDERDRTPDNHRAAYTALARQVQLPWPSLFDTLYRLSTTPAMWHPYPDTNAVLTELHRRGVPIAVVSNIGWDLRPVFRHHGLDRFVDVYALSYEHRVTKPEPGLFQYACDRLGLPPQDVAMVGDNRTADGGAAALGCPVHLVDGVPVEARPDGLSRVLGLLG